MTITTTITSTPLIAQTNTGITINPTEQLSYTTDTTVPINTINTQINYSNLVQKQDYHHPSDFLSEEQLNSKPYRHLNLKRKSNFKLCEIGKLYYIIDNTDFYNTNINYFGITSNTAKIPIKRGSNFLSKEDICILSSIEESDDDMFPIIYDMKFYNFHINKTINVFVGNPIFNQGFDGGEIISVFKINENYTEENEDLFNKKDLKKISEYINRLKETK